MTVYADIIFLINFAMDFVIFQITGKILNKVHKGRIIAGAFIGAIGYCIIMFFNIKGLGGFAVMAASAAVCFKPRTMREFIKMIVITNIVAFAVGGCAMALFYGGNSFGIKNFPLKVLIGTSCGAYIVLKFAVRWFERIREKKQRIFEVKIYRDGAAMGITALTDTGNSLFEPISGKAVIVAEFSKVRELLPEGVEKIFIDGEENNLGKLAESMREFKGFRLIPFSSLGKKNGLMIGFNADKIEILKENEIICREAVIGIYNGMLTEDGFYNALLNPMLIEE